jgi:hypothetical protein
LPPVATQRISQRQGVGQWQPDKVCRGDTQNALSSCVAGLNARIGANDHDPVRKLVEGLEVELLEGIET